MSAPRTGESQPGAHALQLPPDGDDVDDEPEPAGSRLDAWWGRVLCTPTRLRWWYWGAPAAVTLLAAVLRLWNLGSPHSLVFDETYYVKDSWSMLHLGYEGSWPANYDPKFNAGEVNGYTSAPEFVAHPPLGKWIMSLGLSVFGAQNSFGWRVSTAMVGILAVVVLMLIARQLFHSTLLAVIGGFLFAIDGNAIVMSRVALLDNSVMFVALLAFWCILLDRPWHERRLLARLQRARASGADPGWGPVVWWRPWLIAAGVLFGLDAGVKWSGFYFLAVFGVYVVITDALARRRAGLEFWPTAAAFKQGPVSALMLVPTAVAAYIASWSGWLLTTGGWDRTWVQTGGAKWTGILAWVPNWAQNLWHYQTEMYNYSINLHTYHPYMSNPLTWLFMIRPTSMYYQGVSQGQHGCTASACSAAITDLGNPLIWWASAAAVFYLVYRLARYREWKAGLILTGLAAGYLPWMLYMGRTIFQFYAIAFQPYTLLALTMAIGIVLGHRTDPRSRRVRGIRLIAVFLGVAVLLSAFFLPLWTGWMVPYEFWRLHMWMPSWI